jgi:D-alanyl-lipoteichoic acid acyltransferase DltB (MBOAT superfamily)
MADGLKLMAWGFFKKVVVADRLAVLVNDVYGAPRDHEGVSLMLATVFFAFQVYCDFSAYSDIAVGAAHTMGYRLTTNFRTPYFATSIADFWKRWHISLSTWLTDYVYTPLTRARAPRLPWYPKFLLSLFLTFLVSGLWHGASWTFVVWGALHGTYLVGSILTRSLRARVVTALRLERVPRLRTAVQVALTFGLVCVGYVFFRAASLADAWYILTHAWRGGRTLLRSLGDPEFLGQALLFTGHELDFVLAVGGVAVVLAVSVLEARGGGLARLAARPAWQRWAVYYVLTLAIVLGGAFSDEAHQFIYFQF